MRTEPCTFFSDGLQLSGAHFAPDVESEKRLPLIVPCSGFTGLLSIHPARFARYLTQHGFHCFAFDYRGFAESAGQRGRVIIEEQVRDVRNAVSFASKLGRRDSVEVVLIGWGMGAGIVLDAARELPEVQAICCLNGFYSGRRFQLAHRGEDGYRQLLDEIQQERQHAAESGAIRTVDPFYIYPMDPDTTTYVDEVLRASPGYVADQMEFSFADSLVHWQPCAYAHKMDLPLFVAHGTKNRLHPPQEAQNLYDTYAGPKEIYWLEGADHTTWMHDDHPTFRHLGQQIVEWLLQVFRTGTSE